jgi:hypothetical protein
MSLVNRVVLSYGVRGTKRKQSRMHLNARNREKELSSTGI